MRGLVNGIGGTVMDLNRAKRPTSFPLAARELLQEYRVGVYSERGLFLVDVAALSANEAERIGVYYFTLSRHANSPVTRIEVRENV